jgi:hypothetical protein
MHTKKNAVIYASNSTVVRRMLPFVTLIYGPTQLMIRPREILEVKCLIKLAPSYC